VAEAFTCGVDGEYRSACKDLPKYPGTRYCVLHEPGEEKSKEDFLKVKESKLARKDYDFGGAIFPEGTSNFEGFEFDANVAFTGAAFSGTADFRGAQFSGERTYFSRAQFGSADTNFIETTFEKEVTFTEAIFRDNVAFWGRKGNPVFGPGAWARFNYCLIEKPEQFTFNAMSLHPGWFCNTDVRKVDFTDVKWYGMRGCQGTLDEKIRALEARDVQSPHTLLSQACQRLATNAEENRSYPLANDFYYWSMEALRKAGWRRLGLIRIMYWALSGYGVRPGHAFGVLVVIWVVFAALYILVPSSEFYILSPSNSGQVISDVGRAMVYSLGTMARLNPEPKPDPGWFQLTVTFEGLLGPLQIGLLLLAVRRKVMR
jgi:hypothetical protein